MAEKEKDEITENEKDTANESTPAGEVENKEACEQPPAPEKTELEKALEALDTEKEARLRTAAEYDNFRKRTAREREGLLSEAFALAISAFLPLIDNLERACVYKSNPQGLSEGLDLIMKQLEEIKKQIGLAVIDPKGEKFDPEMHNAVLHIEDEACGENTVVEVLQKGYAIEGKVIRHAMVKVAN